MITTRRPGPGRSVLLALLVGLLSSGLVGMHHLAVGGGPGEPSGTSAMTHGTGEPSRPVEQERPSDAGTALLHLCLAVLAVVAVLVVALVLWWYPAPSPVPAVAAASRVRTRPPGSASRRARPSRLAPALVDLLGLVLCCSTRCSAGAGPTRSPRW